MAILPLVVTWAAFDLAARHWYSRPVLRLAFEIVASRSSGEQTIFSKPLARFDAVTGYSCIPGIHEVALIKGRVRIDFRVTIGDDGYRIAGHESVTPSVSAGTQRPALWICGGSYTWGLGVNDEETFPWIVQSSLPAFHVRNLGGNGYGNLQALLQMRDAVKNSVQLPRIAVLVYNDDYLAWNVAAPAYLRMMNASKRPFERAQAAVPVGSLDERDALQVGWIPLFQGQPDSAEPDRAYQIRVTEAVLDSFREICERNHIAAVLAVQSQPAGDPIVDYARRAGYAIADIWVDLDASGGWRYRLQPVDSHPNRAAHAEYAAKLLRVLRRLAPSQ